MTTFQPTIQDTLKEILYDREMQSREEKKKLFIKMNNGKPLSEKAMTKYELNHLSFEEWHDLQYQYLEEEEEEEICPRCGDEWTATTRCNCPEEEEDEEMCCICQEDGDDVHQCWKCDKYYCVDCDKNEMATYGVESHTYCTQCGNDEKRTEEKCNICGSNDAGDKDENYTTNNDGDVVWLCDKCYLGE